MHKIIATSLGLLALSGLVSPISAQTTAVQAGSSLEGAGDEADKMICKKQKRPNSRFTTKVCHTQAEWNAINEVARKTRGETRDRPIINGERGG